MRYSALPALFCCLLLCGCGPTTVNSLVKEQGARQMAARDVLSLVKGNTLSLHSFNEDALLYFDPSGKIFAKGISTDKDKGRWDVSEGSELCIRMEKWWYGDLRCFTVYHIGDKDKVRLANSSGVLQYSAEQAEGDSKGLYSDSDQKKKSLRRSISKQESGQESMTGSATTLEEKRAPVLTEERPSGDHAGKDTGATIEYMAKDCPGCNLAGVDLGKAELIEAKLAGADLHGANLSMANLRRADLQKANLQKAVLTYANLPGADLRGADLRGASLKGANLIKADLTGAKLDGADLTEVLKEGAKGLK